VFVAGFEFARLHVDTDDQGAVRAIVPASTSQVSVDVRRSDEGPSPGGDFRSWRTHVEIRQTAGDEDAFGVVVTASEAVTSLRAAGFAVVREDGRGPGFRSVVRGQAEGPYPCPCCGFITLPERGGYDICEVCFSEDDGQDDHDAGRVRGGPNGSLSLTEARANFKRLGASDEGGLRFVRKPRSGEFPPDSGTRHN
jgi:hypothetical protein